MEMGISTRARGSKRTRPFTRVHLVTCDVRPSRHDDGPEPVWTDRSYVSAGPGNKIPSGTINRSLTEATFRTNGRASRRATTLHLSTCGLGNKKRWRVMPSRLHGARGHPAAPQCVDPFFPANRHRCIPPGRVAAAERSAYCRT